MNEDIEKVKKNLLDRGFHITEALPYGFDFSVYEGEPSETHSKYLVHVLRPYDDMTWLETVRMSRCVHTTNKSILLAIPTRKSVWYIEIKPSWSEVNHSKGG